MERRLTFTQYVQSKQQLVEAIKSDPVVEHSYAVSKYCKMPVGNSGDTKEYINLKPKTALQITWRYTYDSKCEHLQEMQRTPLKVVVVDKNGEQQYDLFQSDEKMSKWIRTNARILSS